MRTYRRLSFISTPVARLGLLGLTVALGIVWGDHTITGVIWGVIVHSALQRPWLRPVALRWCGQPSCAWPARRSTTPRMVPSSTGTT
jgi:hypothetical protein